MSVPSSLPQSQVAEQIRRIARRREISLSELAHRLHVDASVVRSRLSGRHAITVAELLRTAEALGVVPSFLVNENFIDHAHTEGVSDAAGTLPTVDSQIGARLQFALYTRRVTVKQGALLLGLDAPSMSQRIYGNVSLRVHEMMVLSDFLGFSCASFMGERDCELDHDGECQLARPSDFS